MKNRMQKWSLTIWLLIGLFVFSTTVLASTSVDYSRQMGFGWNLGNTFDGFDQNKQLYEESWGNPRVTRELLQHIKAQGYTSIRLPFSVIDRQDENNVITKDFLARYQEVVDMALEEDFYVIINLHHDSWQWLKYWDGQESSLEFERYKVLWEQLATTFKDYDGRVSFESINEPDFEGGDKHAKLQAVNKVFYHIVRKSGGQNEKRVLIFPTLATNSDQVELDRTAAEILSYQDDNIMATVHYYSEWVHSNNMGMTSFDQVLWGDVTPRTSLLAFYDRLTNTFINQGIGVVIGEYGLLAFDRQSYDGQYANDSGELYKYIELMSAKSIETGIPIMLWDNGQHFQRQGETWYNPWFGEIVTKSMLGRSAYAKGFWKSYITDKTSSYELPMEWNGQKLSDIRFVEQSTGTEYQLQEGNDYSVSAEGIALLPNFVDRIKVGEYGLKGQLFIHCQQGAYWIQNISYANQISLDEVNGTVGEELMIPTTFNGEDGLYASLQNEAGNPVSYNTWWPYLVYLDEWVPKNNQNMIYLPAKMTGLLQDGTYRFILKTYQGTQVVYMLTVSDSQIVGKMVQTDTEIISEETTTEKETSETVELTTPNVDPVPDTNTSEETTNNLKSVTSDSKLSKKFKKAKEQVDKRVQKVKEKADQKIEKVQEKAQKLLEKIQAKQNKLLKR
ncbi:cellulase family glycosylhydrolase [Streptococcus sp. S784/96/1]|uniref:cellulase family glycosylhydrolase n=1 Tax=Streptococcus sp. S784/96/1 TaxID=2653499 RepID=UPI00138A1604|nr:cellulase family glycosylhydrolase [Streptococcus sp. S784/96/1]